tara:strand:- start:373 stop:1020 length:648 start_codon:yes stop_codon:yes gene_type:complete
MTLEVETVVAVSLMMAVFSAVAAVGTSIVLGAGFERLRSGFEVVKKQTGFFSDAIHKLEQKVEDVDKQTGQFSQSMHQLEAKVSNVGEQANLFGDSMSELKKKVEVVDKQTGFFSDAINKLEKKVDAVNEHEQIVSEKIVQHADVDLISTAKTEALVSHAENLLTQMATLASEMQTKQEPDTFVQEHKQLDLAIPKNLMHFVPNRESGEERHSFH